jgi:hypothetical protein
VLINCFWRHEIYYINTLLLLVWPVCVVIFAARKELMNTYMEIKVELFPFPEPLGVLGLVPRTAHAPLVPSGEA